MKVRILFFIIALLLANTSWSQSLPVSEAQVRAELEKRGISEEELISELALKGIEIEDLQNLSPSQLAEIESVVTELEARRNDITEEEQATVSEDKEEFLEVPTMATTEIVKEEIKDVIAEELDLREPESRIYGHDFFKNKVLSVFETSTEVKAPSSYILGAGDKLVISIYGISRKELSHEIDNEGYIEVNNRRIFLKGLSLAVAKDKLFETLSRYYRFASGEFDVSLSYSRTVNVNIQGEVSNPGGYTISAINNAFNGLIAAGGPTRIGSLREILLIRSDRTIQNLDFYSYLKNPSEITNASLSEGDIIMVPVSKKLVQISGAVRKGLTYELKSQEALGDLISLAGGFTANANSDLLQIIRKTPQGLRYIDIAAVEIQSFKLQDGDRVLVRSVESEVENFVEVNGAVINNGRYERRDGMQLSDLLQMASLTSDARTDLAFIKRTGDDGKIIYIKVNIEDGNSDLDLNLQNRDIVNIYKSATFVDNQSFKVSGAVRNPGSFGIALDQSISLADALELAGGLRRDASNIGIIHTRDPLTPNVKQYMRVILSEALTNSEFYQLSALDSLEIFSENLFSESSNVKISGAINRPGAFQYGLGMTLADVLVMSGGFTIGAATNKVEISRLLMEDNQPTRTIIADFEVDRELTEGSENLDFVLQPYDEIQVRYVPEFELQQVVKLSGEVKYPGEYSLIKENETVREILKRAGGITLEAFPTAAKLIRQEDELGVVIIRLDEVLSENTSKFNFKLKDGDQIVIPKSKDFVSIVGATNANKLYSQDIIGAQNQINVPYHPGKDAKFYIEYYAGGVSRTGSANEIFVENVNGEVRRTKNYFIYKDYPNVEMGSKIVVGAKPAKTQEQKDREDVDWSKVLADSVGQAVSILSLLLLIQRI